VCGWNDYTLLELVIRAEYPDELLDAKLALIIRLVDAGALGDMSSSALHVCVASCTNDSVGVILATLLQRYSDMLELKNDTDITPLGALASASTHVLLR
jgi:hypothetical protein